MTTDLSFHDNRSGFMVQTNGSVVNEADGINPDGSRNIVQVGRNVGLETILQNAIAVPANGTAIYMGNSDTLKITEISGVSSSRTILFEVSNLVNGTYTPIQGVKLSDLSMGTQTSNVSEIWQFDGLAGLWFRARVSAVFGIVEVASLTTSASPTSSGNVTVTLDGITANVAVTIGVAEAASLLITAPATVASNVVVTLNGVATNVAVLATDTAINVADKIRATTFAGWTTGGTVGTTTVTFTATAVGTKTDAVYGAGTTGATGTMTTTTQGIDADTTTSVATKIRATTFTGWTTGGTGTTVTFTATTDGDKVDAIYSAGTTGATGAMTISTQGASASLTVKGKVIA